VKNIYKMKFTLLTILLSLNTLLFAQERTITTLQNDWKFAKGQHDSASEITFDDAAWQTVSVPHDWAIGGAFIPDGDANTGKLPWKGEGWYRKMLDIPTNYAEKRLFLLCDGIMAFPKIYVNGKLAGQWDYGYNSFFVDITDFVKVGAKNTLAIHADTRQHDSRWYPGAGIFRKIQLIAVNPIHVDVWGTQITTPILKPHYADVRVATSLSNLSKTKDSVTVKYRILTAENNVVAEGEAFEKMDAKAKKTSETTLTISNPRLWSVENPNLYTLETQIFQKNKRIDHVFSTFGVRKIEFTPDNGFFLNDKRVQLKGANLHHDLGLLGAAFNTRAMERELEIMKNMGCNAIRTSHNMPAPELLDLCDKMGLLVIDEAFDKYDAKADILQNTDFEEFTLRNIKNFVQRDRNHPCIFLWSVGNEIGDVQWNINGGFQKLQTMVNAVKKFDSTRPVTLVCDNAESAERRHFDYYDVHAWNYGHRYTLARQLEPNKSVIISESASTLSTRGFYEFPLPAKKTDFTLSKQVSSYDLNAPWWAEVADDDFMWQQEEPYVAGEFIWTGFDYLGEPTPYDNDWAEKNNLPKTASSCASYFGAVDLCGIPKDRFYLYKSYWKTDETTIHILPHWNWENRIGQNVPVFVYTNGDAAELFLNGKSLGKRSKNPKSKNSIERFRLMWNEVVYQPGTLKVVVYKEGQILGEKTLKTAGKPTQIRLSPDKKTLKADGNDLSYVLIEALDSEGNLCPLADAKIEIQVSGEGKLKAVGNGNPQSFEPFHSQTVQLFYGKAMLIVGSEMKTGTVKINATSKDLKGENVVLKVE
jgi:beta-galactosidase